MDNERNIVDESDKSNNPINDEETLQNKIQELQEKHAKIKKKRNQLSASIQSIQNQHDRIAVYKNNLKQQLSNELSQLHSISMRLQSNREWLSIFRKVNALNDCFHIWHRGQFSTINGFRLGSDVPPIPIPEDLQWKSTSSRLSPMPTFSGASHVSNIELSGNGDNTIYTGIGPHTSCSIENEARERSDGQGKSQSMKKDNQTQLSSSHANKGTITLANNPNPSGQNSNLQNYNHFKVSWSEINAALGTAALLLSTLHENKNNPIAFRCHKIIPMGSFSKIVLLPILPNTNKSPVTYNLYSDDSFSLFGKRNFNIALNALLKCLKDAADIVQERDKAITLPYDIGDYDHQSNQSTPTSIANYYSSSNKGDLLIGGLSLSYGADGERWTRALKYFLTDLKWLLAFTVKHVDR